MRLALRIAMLAVLPLPLAAQVNREEGDARAAACPGPARAIALAPTDSLDLDGSSRVLTFGGSVTVCVDATSVTLLSPEPRTIPCATIRDSAEEGIGHYFAVEGLPHHLWFHIAPESQAPTLEIGVYREDVELAWIDTAIPICRE